MKNKQDINTKPLIGDDEAFATFEEVLKVNDYIKSLNGEIQELNPNDFEIKDEKISVIDKTPDQLWEIINDVTMQMKGEQGATLNMRSQRIIGLVIPLEGNHAATKYYVDNEIAKVSSNYIVGELKWVKINTKMPRGWVKVVTKGKGIACLAQKQEEWYSNHLAIFSGDDEELLLDINCSEKVKEGMIGRITSNENYSLIDFIGAELWEYNPTKYAEIIAQGLTPWKYAKIESKVNNE